MLTRQKNREIVFHLLYCADFAPGEQEEAFSLLMALHKVTKKNLYLASEQVQQVQKELKAIDQMIGEASTEYAFDRIPGVERNVLRLGVYEIFFSTTPPKVAIAEAIRLGRKFASAEGAKFINAILDHLHKKKNAV